MNKLFNAITRNDLQEVKKIIEKNPSSVNSVAKAPPKYEAGKSPLQVAVEYDCIEIIYFLLENGADVNYLGPNQARPALCDLITKVLIDGVSKYNDDNAWDEHINLIHSLIEKGADVNLTDYNGTNAWMQTILSYTHAARSIKSIEQINKLKNFTKKILDILLENGADIYYLGEGMLYMSYMAFILNIMNNREVCYGIEEAKKENWKATWGGIEEILSPYYMNTPEAIIQRSEASYKTLMNHLANIGNEKKEEHEEQKEQKKNILSQEEIKNANQLIQSIMDNKVDAALHIMKTHPQTVHYILENNNQWKDYNGQSVFQIALNAGCNVLILHGLIASGIDVNYMPPSQYIPEGSQVTYADGVPVYYTKDSETVYLPENIRDEKREPILQSVINKVIYVAGLGGKDYADQLVGVSIHLLDKGAEPDKKDSDGYNAWLKLLSAAQMIISNIPDRTHEALFLLYLEKCLRVLAEYCADIFEKSTDQMSSLEDIIRNIEMGKEPLKNLKKRSLIFWNGPGQPLLQLMEKFYKNYDGAVSEKARLIHKILGTKRYTLRTEIVESLENGDKELIKEIAGLYAREDTPEGREKAELLLQMIQ